MYKVMVVEDQAMPRQLLEMIIAQSDGFELAYSLESAALAEVYCLSAKIDLVLMDVCTAMGESGLDAAARIKRKFPHIKVIVMTSMPECSYIARAREAQADGFWYKEDADMPILEMMERTMAGESIYPDATPELRIGLASSREFTDRELEVLRELTSGDADTVIAERLGMSVWTARSHIKHLLEKTGFESRTRLAVAARESGLVIRGY